MTTPEALAELHRAAFHIPPPWSAQDFAGFLGDSACFLCAVLDGDQVQAFALFRVVVDEAELLTLATKPGARRKGHARAVLHAGLAESRRRGAAQCFLEVASDNFGAISLYHAEGFVQQGLRRNYYRVPGHPPLDALILRASLTADNHTSAGVGHHKVISC